MTGAAFNLGVATAAGARALSRDLNGHAVAAGLTTGLLFASVGLSVHLETSTRIGLTDTEAASWFFAASLTAGVTSLALSAAYQQPIQITPSLAGWVFLASVGARYTLPEIAGAVLVTGVLVVALGLSGATERVMRFLPLPIVMGVFAGSILGFATSIFQSLDQKPLVIGAALAGFLVASMARRSWLPPVAVAAAAAIVTALLAGDFQTAALAWEAPTLQFVTPAFNPDGLLALSLPLLVMVFGIGNVQGFGFLMEAGYSPPLRSATIAGGVASLVNGAFGSPPASLGRTSVALVAGEEAGPRGARYTASLIAAVAIIALGLTAGAANSLVLAFPAGLIVSIAGLAILRALLNAVRASVTSSLQFGPFVALLIAASPLEWFGVGAAFWAFVGGMIASFAVERDALRASLHQS